MKYIIILSVWLCASSQIFAARDFSKNLSNWMTLGVNKIGPALGSVGGMSYSFVIWKDTAASSEVDVPAHFYNGGGSIILWYSNIGFTSPNGRHYFARIPANSYGVSFNTTPLTTTGVWERYVVTVDWSANPYQFRIYKDGSLMSSGSFATAGGNYTHTTATAADTIGCQSSSSTGVAAGTVYQIDGGMAEVAVWKKVLTAGDAVSLGSGACPLKVQPASLVTYWKLNGQGSPEIELFNKIEGTINGSVPVREHPAVR